MKKKLISFLGDPEIKAKKIADMKMHHELDNLRQGAYWYGEKGCAVTCTMFTTEEFKTGNVIYSDIHERYETELGIPRIIARLEDRIFEGLTVSESKQWTLDFLEAIPVGVNLEPVWRKFMIWLLIDATDGVIRHAKTEASKKAIKDIAKAFKTSLTKTVPIETWVKLRAADAYDADAYVYTAAAAAAAAAATAAYTATAADDAAAAAAAATDDATAKRRKYTIMAAKLIELLKEAE